MKTEDMMNLATLAAVGLGLYLAYKGVKAVGGAAGAAAEAVGNAASAAGNGVAAGVSAVGSIFSLPGVSETIDNPAQVRWIIDNVGSFAASQWGTASAYVRAINMPAGSGNNNPPPDYVLRALGVSSGYAYTQTSNQVADYITGGRDYSGSLLGSGPSFGDIAGGKTSTNVFQW